MYSSPGIYNALDTWPGAATGMSPHNTGAQNYAALQAVINAAQSTSNKDGAIVLIPSFDGHPYYGNYSIDVSSGPITIPSVSADSQPLLICGTGGRYDALGYQRNR